MKPPFRPVRNFFHSNSGTLCPHKYILKGTLFRGISHLTDATFKTTSSSNVVEQFFTSLTMEAIIKAYFKSSRILHLYLGLL